MTVSTARRRTRRWANSVAVTALAVAGLVATGAAPAHSAESWRVAFSTSAAATPSGFTKDVGAAWTDSKGSGWVRQDSLSGTRQPLDLTRNTRLRGAPAAVPEQRGLLHMQYADAASSEPGNKTPGAFEVAVPNGWYVVTGSVGDLSDHPGDTPVLRAEGTRMVGDVTLSSADRQRVGSATVQVTDGRVTFDAVGGKNTKLNYITVAPTTKPLTAKVRFAPEASARVAGYLTDYGQPFGRRSRADQGGQTFGWLRDGRPTDLTSTMRDRVKEGSAPASTPALRSGLAHLQLPEGTSASWEMTVPNGAYLVTASVGDAKQWNDTTSMNLNVEGQNAVAAFAPIGANGAATLHTQGTRFVTVTDGKLTLNATGGRRSKINWVSITGRPDMAQRPSVASTTPGNVATNVSPTSSVVADLALPGGGVSLPSLTQDAAYLTRVSDRTRVSGAVTTSGGGDTLNVSPTSLAESTTYRLTVTDKVRDVRGRSFTPYSVVFTTGKRDASGVIDFQRTDSGAPAGSSYTSLVMGPDNKLYAGSLYGDIYRFTIGADGKLGQRETINTVKRYSASSASGDTYAPGMRSVIGMAFDPASTAQNPILWITDNIAFTGAYDVPDFSSRIARLSGSSLQTYTPVVTGLPRSVKDHAVNSLAFGPDKALYVNVGSNSAMGAADATWGNRPEELLSAAVLRLDTTAIGSTPLNARTGRAGTYNPYAAGAPLTFYATGVRNAFDLLWHSNSSLYVPTNGSAAGGAVPAVPSPLPASCARRPDRGYTGQTGVKGIAALTQSETDYVFRVRKNKYYGHPNPTRCEWILNSGNPTSGSDPFEVKDYPVGTTADPNYDVGNVYDAGNHASANGVIEYKSGAFGGALKGKLLYVRYSSGQDIVTVDVDSAGALRNRTVGAGGMTGLRQPLDLVEDTRSGRIYVSQLTNDPKTTSIAMLSPRQATAAAELKVANPDPAPFADQLTLSRIQKPAATAQRFSDTGTVTVSNPGTAPLTITGVQVPAGFSASGLPVSTVVAPGQSRQVSVTFTGKDTRVHRGTLTVTSNAAKNPTQSVRLTGLWQSLSENNQEPSLAQISQAVGSATSIPTSIQSRGEFEPLGEESLSRFWTRADTSKPATVRQLAAYHGYPNAAAFKWHAKGQTNATTVLTMDGKWAQSVLPRKPDGAPGSASFSPTGAFGLGVDGEWSDPARNNASVDVQKGCKAAVCGHHLRLFPVKDAAGKTVPNTYLVAMDYSGINYDFQDNVYLVSNIKPSS